MLRYKATKPKKGGLNQVPSSAGHKDTPKGGASTNEPKKLAFSPAPAPRMHIKFEEAISTPSKTAAKCKEDRDQKTDVKQLNVKHEEDAAGKDVKTDATTEAVTKKRPNDSNAENKKSKKQKKSMKLEEKDEQKPATKDAALDADLSSDIDSAEEASLRARLAHIMAKRAKKANAAAAVTDKKETKPVPQSLKSESAVQPEAKPKVEAKDQKIVRKNKKKGEAKQPLGSVQVQNSVKASVKPSAGSEDQKVVEKAKTDEKLSKKEKKKRNKENKMGRK